jgi:hypothetical protein
VAPPADPEADSGTPADPELPDAGTAAGADPPLRQGRPTDPCQVRTVGHEPRLEKYRREIFETVCEAAARFDSFFGNRRFDEEARRTRGRAGIRLIWDEDGGAEVDGTLDVKIDFPNLDNRLNAFLGRQDRDTFVTGTEDDLSFLPTFFEREGGQEWLVGLGYRPVSSERSSLDFDIGADVDSSFDPFVRSRYRHYWLIGDENLLRARQTVYYSEEKRLGSASRLDFERPFGTRTLARWTGEAVFDEKTEGADWITGITLFHGFTPNRAISWFVGVNGETGRDVPIEDFGTRLIVRQRMFRPWFFGELITGLTWPRESLAVQREAAFHVGFGFEIHFSGEELGAGRR